MCIFYTHVKIPPLAFTSLFPHFSFYCKPFSSQGTVIIIVQKTWLLLLAWLLVIIFLFPLILLKEDRARKRNRERERGGKKEENYFWDVKGKSKHLLSETVKGWFNLGLHMDMQEAQLSFLFLLSIIYQMSSWATVELLHMHTEIITRSAAKLRN